MIRYNDWVGQIGGVMGAAREPPVRSIEHWPASPDGTYVALCLRLLGASAPHANAPGMQSKFAGRGL